MSAVDWLKDRFPDQPWTRLKLRLNPVLLLKDHARSALQLRIFTALLGVEAGVPELKLRLEDVDRSQEASDVLGVQNLRWVLFQPTVDNDDPAHVREAAPYALVLSFVYDGPLDDALNDLLASAKTQVILSHCRGYTKAKNLDYLKRHAIRCGYMYRDLGPVRPEDGEDGWDATKAEIDDAFDVQRRFEEFYEDETRRRGNWQGLRQRFLRAFFDDAFPFAASGVERRSDDEDRVIRRVSETVRRTQSREAREVAGGKVRRGAHAKGHGFLRGTIKIATDIPREYAKGLFRASGEIFPIRARLSNATTGVQADSKRDARGFAFTVDVPLGGPLAFTAGDFLLPESTPRATRQQDFLLLSHPVFFVRDVRQAAQLFSIISLKKDPVAMGTRLAAFALTDGAWRQLWLAVRTLGCRASHVFEPVFHSAVPYALGADHVVKYSAEVVSGAKPEPSISPADDDMLRDTLSLNLARGPIRIELYVHAVSVAAFRRSPEALIAAVEDASADWSALRPRKVHVATLRFEMQDPASDEATRQGEAWSFNPWNGMHAHRPLGSINRGRLRIMENSFGFRTQSAAAARASRAAAAAARQTSAAPLVAPPPDDGPLAPPGNEPPPNGTSVSNDKGAPVNDTTLTPPN